MKLLSETITYYSVNIKYVFASLWCNCLSTTISLNQIIDQTLREQMTVEYAGHLLNKPNYQAK